MCKTTLKNVNKSNQQKYYLLLVMKRLNATEHTFTSPMCLYLTAEVTQSN